MLLARYAPVGSQRYEKLAQAAKSFDKIMEWLPAQLFGIWSIFIAGMAAGKAQTDRYYFWDWSDWLIGLIGILVITLLFFSLKRKLKIKELREIDLAKNTVTSTFYYIYFLLLFTVGWLTTSALNMHDLIGSIVLYMAFPGSMLFLHTIKTEDVNIFDLKQKYIHTGIGIILLLFCIIFGYMNDDPVISTASLVSLPFLVVLLFGKHVRHLERAKFYPIFIIAMFVVAREAWFLIPLLLLFFILRSYNYLRYQKVYPTFGVTTDDQS